jgi:GDPmannose 4,6-dehydratase
MSRKTALITGISGQDAAYLSKLLLEEGYNVIGAGRRSSTDNLWRLRHFNIHQDIPVIPFELLEESNIKQVIEKYKPDEVYNLAAQSFVASSFDQPIYTADVDGMGVLRLLEAIRQVNPQIKFYQASSSEMFGKVQEVPQTETTRFYPRSPYGAAKAFAHHLVVNYRESYGMFACNGILFNH